MTVLFTRNTVLRRRDEIMRRWEAIVVGEPRGIVLGGSLLRDALPDLLDALAESLEQTDTVVTPLIRTITERHVKDRLDQSFKLAQFIHEYRWLRKVIIAVVLEAEAGEQALAGTAAQDEKAARVVTLARLNEVLDDSILDAVEWFVQERDRRLADAESTAERYRALAQLSPEAIFVHRGGPIEFANVAAARLLGATSNAVLAGRSLAELFDPAEYDAFRAQTDRLLHGETIVPKGELTITRSDGRPRLVEAVASLIELPDGPVVEVVAREITDRKQAERLLREAHQRQTDFLAVLSHELRNPLAPIQNAVEIMRRVAPDSPQRGRALDVIDRQVTHLTELVSDLLDLSRINHGKITLARTRFDARDVVRLACDDMQPTFAARGITLRLDLETAPLAIDADAARVAQIVTNLLSNAAKFTPRSGRVDLNLGSADGACELTVHDTGVGIEPALLSAIFEPFAQAEQTRGMARGGLGIGLAIVKKLVELHGGTIRAFSEGPGRGSEFTVSIPLAEAADSPGTDRSPMPEAPLSVLIIEDNQDAADTLATILELRGHETRIAYDGHSGVAAFAKETPDVIFCDVGLPDETGYDVIRAIRRLPASDDVFVIAVTGYAQREDVERAMNAGFNAHVSKPVSIARVAELLAQATEERAARARTRQLEISLGARP